MSISTQEKRKFYRDLREVLKNNPKFAGRVALAEIPRTSRSKEKTSPVLGVKLSSTRAQVCLKWGIDPETGERVCLQWADASG